MALYLGTNQVDIMGPSEGFMKNGRLIATKNFEFKLSDTNFSSITPTTTAQSLNFPATDYSVAGTSVTCFRLGSQYDGTIIDPSNHDYVVFFESVAEFAYSSSVSGTIHGIRGVYTRDFQHGRYRNSIDSSTGMINTSSLSTTGSTYLTSRSLLLYQKADNTYAVYTTAYGVYLAPTPAAIVGSNASSGYINLNLASMSVRAHDSYFPVAAIQALNTTNTKIKNTWYVYEGDQSMYGKIYSAYELVANK